MRNLTIFIRSVTVQKILFSLLLITSLNFITCSITDIKAEFGACVIPTVELCYNNWEVNDCEFYGWDFHSEKSCSEIGFSKPCYSYDYPHHLCWYRE